MIRECWHVAIIFAGRLSLPAICHNNSIQIDDKLLGLTILLFSSVTLAPTLTTKLQSASIVVESLMLVVSFMLVDAESSGIGCVCMPDLLVTDIATDVPEVLARWLPPEQPVPVPAADPEENF